MSVRKGKTGDLRRAGRLRRLAALLVALLVASLSGAGPVLADEDPYVALQTSNAGTLSFVRRAEIDAYADASGSDCILILGNGEDVRAFQKCSSLGARMQNKSYVSFPNEFGMAVVSPAALYDLLSASNGSCRLNLRNGKHVSVRRSCAEVHEALPRE